MMEYWNVGIIESVFIIPVFHCSRHEYSKKGLKQILNW